MPAGQFGPRDVKKQLWRLEIPAFDPTLDLHQHLATAAANIAEMILTLWHQVQADRAAKQKTTSGVVARRTINRWLDQAPEVQVIEQLSHRLLD